MTIYKREYFIAIFIFFANLRFLFASEIKNETIPRSITISGDTFLLDGKPFQILSGSIHYFRVPAAYWRDRLKKLKAAGLNAVSTYVEWSYHEPEERRCDFIGDRDIVQFIRLAAAEKLYVLLRPGPYICAERDMGGLPYWLLARYPNIHLRSTDKDFMRETKIWFAELFSRLRPLLYGNGGPIIMVQVENEYTGKEHYYMTAIRNCLMGHVGKNALLYTTNSFSSDIKKGAVAKTLTTINFGSDRVVPDVFDDLRAYMPHGPLMNSEFYSGWLTHWGETFKQADTTEIVHVMRNMLNNNISFNIYMFHGGTNFEFSAGANYDSKYQPHITSYDYDAPLDEAGDPTPKYYEIRRTIEKFFPEVKKIPLPLASPKFGNIEVALKRKVHLLSPEGRKTFGKVYSYGQQNGIRLPTFEALRQRSGLMLYDTSLHSNVSDMERLLLSIDKPRDRAYVYIDGKLKGVFGRNQNFSNMRIDINNKNRLLSLLVENQGRINYGPGLHDWKGILGMVLLTNHDPLRRNWTITGFPLENVGIANNVSSENNSKPDQGPALYEGSFTLPEDAQPLDTFLDTSGWGKGYVWVNGHNLGRYWPGVGPQVTLYVPGAWLLAAPATNRLQLLELESSKPGLKINFIDHHILNKKQTRASSLSTGSPVISYKKLLMLET